MPKPKNYKPRRSQKWFEGKIGKFVTKNNTLNLFEPAILILSKHHAMALHASQDKGNRYE